MTKKGFTIMELIVVIGILSIIVLVVSQPLVSVIKYQRESQITDNMRDNLQFVINKMEKELKTASDVLPNPASGVDSINFKDQADANVSYSLSGDVIIKNGTQQLTDKTVFKVTSLKFWNNSTTKLVTIVIEAESLDGQDKTTMQTSVYPLNNKP